MASKDEPDAAGARNYGGMGAGFSLKMPELDAARDTVLGLNHALETLRTALGKFNSFTASSLTSVLKTIRQEATGAANAVYGVSSSFGSGGGGGGGGGGGSAFAGANYAAAASAQIASSVGRMSGGLNGSQYFQNPNGGLITDLAMAPLNFIRERFTTNRNTALQGAGAFSMLARQQGVHPGDVLGSLGTNGMPAMGTPQDLMSLMSMAPALGASYNFGGKQGGQGVRAAGFFEGVRQAQVMNPYDSVQNIAQTIGGYAANTGAQQRSTMMTGGAYSIIGGGGRQKSLSQWAESIMKWLMDLRVGNKRGKPFSYGELMAQYFPGSNIDAWFDVNGVPQNMRDYWWTYALQKAGGSASTAQGGEMTIGADDQNLAYKRLQATQELTKTEFGLAGSMGGAYLNRESSNRWFNQMFGSIQQSLMPAIANKVPAIQYMPDTIEDMLFSLTQGAVGMGGDALTTLIKNKLSGKGDVGDIGDYGEFGGTTTSGMHPDMKSKLGRMMAANPRLSITSGLRDTNMQRNLKNKGHSRVSGKGSAHTRGMAADLGPASEYAWIAKNAGKFGLKSGVGKGEPWHVGMGDVGDITDDVTNGIKAMFGASGMDVTAFSGGVDELLKALMSKLGSWAGGLTPGVGPAYEPGLFDQLMGTKPGAGLSGQGLTGSFDSRAGSQAYGGSGVGSSSSRQGSITDRQRQAAIVANNAGFTGDALIKMVAIAGRESGYEPTAHRSDHVPKVPEFGDRGLWQINYINDPALKRAGIISQPSDLFNPATNAAAAYFLYQQAGRSFSPWGMGNQGWAGGGDPMNNTDMASAYNIVHSVGLGDVEAMAYAGMMPRSGGGGRGMMQFNNNFTISGGGNGAGAGGIDVRRTVTMIADQLEGEMTRRMARVN